MDRFTLKPEHKKAAENILVDNGIEISSLYAIVNNIKLDENSTEFDFYENEEFFFHLIDTYKYQHPLFLEGDDKLIAMKQLQNWQALLHFHEFAKYESENIDEFMMASTEHEKIEEVRRGIYPIHLLGKKYLTVDFAHYGFSDAFEMTHCLSAFIINHKYRIDNREVEIPSIDNTHTYVYKNHTHGDFRLYKYDNTITSMIDPIEPSKTLPFGKPKNVGALLGYHSIETSFLALLIYLSEFTDCTCDAIENFDKYFENEVKKMGQRFGNYADAGYHDNSNTAFLFLGFPFKDAPRLMTEFETKYESKLRDGNLIISHMKCEDNSVINPCIMVIQPIDVNNLIKGLFKKVSLGNGRSSVIALKDTIEYYKQRKWDRELT